jgi:hypothetical protein
MPPRLFGIPLLLITPRLLDTHLSPRPILRGAIPLTRQHTITSSNSKLGASPPNRHLAGYTLRNVTSGFTAPLHSDTRQSEYVPHCTADKCYILSEARTRRDRVGITTPSHLRSLRVNSPFGIYLSQQDFRLFLSLCRQIQGPYLKLRHDHFLSHPFQFSIHYYLPTPHYKACVTETAVRQTARTLTQKEWLRCLFVRALTQARTTCVPSTGTSSNTDTKLRNSTALRFLAG